PGNLPYYPDLQARLEELKGVVDSAWVEMVFGLRGRLDRPADGLPSPEEIADWWRATEIRPAPLPDDRRQAAWELRWALIKVYQLGGAVFGRFVLAPSESLRRYCSLNRWADVRFLSHFVRAAALARVLPNELAAGLTTAPREDYRGYGRAPVSGLVRHIGATVPSWAKARLRGLALRYCTALFGNRTEDVAYGHTAESWSPWFVRYGEETDHHTWVTMDAQDWTVTLLCTTNDADV